MSGITVVSPDDRTEQTLAERYRGELVVRRLWSETWPSPESATAEIVAAAPDIIVIGPAVEREDAEDILLQVDRTHPHVGVIVVLDTPSNDLTVDLMRKGARDVLSTHEVAERLTPSVERVLEIVEHRRVNLTTGSGGRRKIITLLSPKGGTGKTTLATNLALGMANRAPNQVLLIDFDLQFGDAATALGLTAEYSIANAAALPTMERAAMKVFLTMHPSTLAVLAPPEDFTQSEELDAASVKATLAALLEEYPYVVIDTAAGIDEFSLLATEFATDLAFVTTTDVPSIRATKRQLDALDSLGLMGHRRHFLLNRADARVGLSTSDVEATVGMEADLTFPSSRHVPVSTNQGIPLLAGEGRDNASRAMQKMVDHFLPDPSEGPSGPGLFSKLRRS